MKWLIRDKHFYRTLIALAIPVAAQNLITFLVGFADNLMVSTLGDSAVSGVYMGNQIQTLLQVLGAGIEAAMLILSAQSWGKRDLTSIRKIVSIGLRASVIFGLAVMTICAIAPSLSAACWHVLAPAGAEKDGAAFAATSLQAISPRRSFMHVSLLALDNASPEPMPRSRMSFRSSPVPMFSYSSISTLLFDLLLNSSLWWLVCAVLYHSRLGIVKRYFQLFSIFFQWGILNGKPLQTLGETHIVNFQHIYLSLFFVSLNVCARVCVCTPA